MQLCSCTSSSALYYSLDMINFCTQATSCQSLQNLSRFFWGLLQQKVTEFAAEILLNCSSNSGEFDLNKINRE